MSSLPKNAALRAVQDIGGSIQVLSGDALAETVATGFSGCMRQIPSLSTNTSGVGQAQLAMRDHGRAIEPR
ncbi:MAG: hypothetical protein U5K38_11935 [Woeseiaceae bacterium]|nr:hypothetical protein [Woeseiaceae bacterium]